MELADLCEEQRVDEPWAPGCTEVVELCTWVVCQCTVRACAHAPPGCSTALPARACQCRSAVQRARAWEGHNACALEDCNTPSGLQICSTYQILDTPWLRIGKLIFLLANFWQLYHLKFFTLVWAFRLSQARSRMDCWLLRKGQYCRNSYWLLSEFFFSLKIHINSYS